MYLEAPKRLQEFRVLEFEAPSLPFARVEVFWLIVTYPPIRKNQIMPITCPDLGVGGVFKEKLFSFRQDYL
jgi:hypothetical protein